MLTQTPAATKFALEIAFTGAYREHQFEPAPIREAYCLRVLYPALFENLKEGDRFAGRLSYRPVGIGLEQASGGPGYYCYDDEIRRALEGETLSEEEAAQIEDMIEFWKREATIPGVLVSMLSDDVRRGTENDVADMFGRLSGAELDFNKLVTLGIPGLRGLVASYYAAASREGRSTANYVGWQMALDLLAEVCFDYARRAREQALSASPEWSAQLHEIAARLERLTRSKPETFREAAQLAWLYALISGVVNYGRVDVYLGDFYARDIDAGLVTEAEALADLQSLWRLIAARHIVFNSRVIVGGMGRPNEPAADRFALAAMEATRTVIEIEPQLTLRFYQGQNPALMEKALDVIGEGRTFPMLYNDDVNVPAVEHGFGVPRAAAEQYLPYGCGEYALDHISFGSPNCSLNLLKALEIALRDGRDPKTGEQVGPRTGELDSLATYDDLFAAYRQQVEHFTRFLARRHALEYQAEAKSAGFLFISMLFDGCIERGRSVVEFGTIYTGGVIETVGMVNAADSLTAIKKLVYDRPLISTADLLAALDANFEGYERVHRMLAAAPKYGNDDDEADATMRAVSDHVARCTRDQAAAVGLDYYLVVNINNHAHVTMGALTNASPDGRKDGAPLANGNTPTAGNDRKGVTAFLNSIASIDPTCHAGYVQNMKFSRRMFREERTKVRALLDGYFMRGGTQAMITVVSKEDMENAMREPEKYRNLIVRVGGFSARFVELAPNIQRDLINRTLYD